MGRIVTLLFLSAALALFYVKFLRSGEVPPEAPVPGVEIAPISKLTTFTGENLGRIFAKLNGESSATIAQQLRQLRAAVAARKPQLRAELQPMYQGGIELCDLLLETLKERDRCNFSLNDTRSKPYSTSLSADEKDAEVEKRDFFEGGIQTRWAENSGTYRKRADALFRWIRDAERRLVPPPTPVPPDS